VDKEYLDSDGKSNEVINILTLHPLEKAVLEKICTGDHPVQNILREQIKVMSVLERRMTGVGFFTKFFLPSTAPSVPIVPMKIESAIFGDVGAKIPELHSGAGFLLFLKSGYLYQLEGYSYEESWPENINSFELFYFEPERAKLLGILSKL
jgi:hypothetical protein